MQEHTVCIRCGRKLKSPESRKLGFGKICFEKWNAETLTKPLFEKGEENAKKQRRHDKATPDSTE